MKKEEMAECLLVSIFNGILFSTIIFIVLKGLRGGPLPDPYIGFMLLIFVPIIVTGSVLAQRRIIIQRNLMEVK